jgi:hypothetical protein
MFQPLSEFPSGTNYYYFLFQVGKTYGLWKCVDTVASSEPQKAEAVAS